MIFSFSGARLYTRADIEQMKKAAAVVKEVLRRLEDYIKPGITTKDIDKFVEDTISSMSALPSPKGYHGYPAACCTSVNEVVVHGIPSDRVLNEGDIVSVDVMAVKDGFHSDACRTFPVGRIGNDAERLIRVTREAFFKGVEMARVGNRVGDISNAIQKHVEAAGFGVVREFQGHGVGRHLHEEPRIDNLGKPNRGSKLKQGMVFAIEPMVTFGSYEVKTLDDKWTTVTVDHSISAHYENTIAMTNGEPLILTL